jgi:hypothetical protein
MKLKYKLLIVVAILAIVPISIYSGRLYTIATLSGRANEPNCNTDYISALKFLEISNVSDIAYFRGLPHYYSSADDFNKAVWNNDYFSVAGYPFYLRKMAAKNNKPENVIKMVTDIKSYRRYGGPKLCGGYHADLAVRITHKNGISWLLLCFGCEEVIIVNESGVSYIMEMKKIVYDYMHALFKDIV